MKYTTALAQIEAEAHSYDKPVFLENKDRPLRLGDPLLT